MGLNDGAPTRLGVIGMARIFPAHLRGLKAVFDSGYRDFRITALCARNADDALRFRLRGEGPAPRPPASPNLADALSAPHSYVSDLHPDTVPDIYTDYRKMLDADAVDAVIVLAPIYLHHQIALDCIAAGKHVLVEKPVAITVRAAKRIVDEGRRKGVIVGVAENQHYNARIRVASWLVGDGRIGEPQLWFSGFFGNEWSPNLIVAHTPWRHRKLQAGAGGALDVGVHHFHQMRVLVSEVDEVSAYTKVLEPERIERDEHGAVVRRVPNEVEDVYVASFRYASGAIGSAFWGWGGRGEPTVHAVHPILYGTRGVLKGDEVVFDDGSRAPVARLFDEEASAALKERFFPGGVRDAFGLETRDFVQAIRKGRQMESSGDSGLRDMAVAYAVLESATTGRPVRPEDVLEGKVAAYQSEIDEHYGLV